MGFISRALKAARGGDKIAFPCPHPDRRKILWLADLLLGEDANETYLSPSQEHVSSFLEGFFKLLTEGCVEMVRFIGRIYKKGGV
jgi:hypothetical protein